MPESGGDWCSILPMSFGQGEKKCLLQIFSQGRNGMNTEGIVR